LPTDIPENITFDISSLKEIGDHLKVSDAKVGAEVEIKTDPEQIVIALQEPMKEEVIPVVEEVSEEITGAEGETPAERRSQRRRKTRRKRNQTGRGAQSWIKSQLTKKKTRLGGSFCISDYFGQVVEISMSSLTNIILPNRFGYKGDEGWSSANITL